MYSKGVRFSIHAEVLFFFCRNKECGMEERDIG